VTEHKVYNPKDQLLLRYWLRHLVVMNKQTL